VGSLRPPPQAMWVIHSMNGDVAASHGRNQRKDSLVLLGSWFTQYLVQYL